MGAAQSRISGAQNNVTHTACLQCRKSKAEGRGYVAQSQKPNSQTRQNRAGKEAEERAVEHMTFVLQRPEPIVGLFRAEPVTREDARYLVKADGVGVTNEA